MSLTDSRITSISEQYGGNFRPGEFLSGRENLSSKIVTEINRFRAHFGFPMQLTSCWRDYGSHYSAKCTDFLMWAKWKESQPYIMHMWRMVTLWPFTGVGIYFDWNDGIGFHGDVMTQKDCERLKEFDGKDRTRPLRWLRKEGTYYYQDLKDGRFYADGAITTLQTEIESYLA